MDKVWARPARPVLGENATTIVELDDEAWDKDMGRDTRTLASSTRLWAAQHEPANESAADLGDRLSEAWADEGALGRFPPPRTCPTMRVGGPTPSSNKF